MRPDLAAEPDWQRTWGPTWRSTPAGEQSPPALEINPPGRYRTHPQA